MKNFTETERIEIDKYHRFVIGTFKGEEGQFLTFEYDRGIFIWHKLFTYQCDEHAFAVFHRALLAHDLVDVEAVTLEDEPCSALQIPDKRVLEDERQIKAIFGVD